MVTASQLNPAVSHQEKKGRRYLEIHLLYTEDCPPEYEPPGFKRTTDDSIRFPLSDNWCRESQSCGAMDSGYHTCVFFSAAF